MEWSDGSARKRVRVRHTKSRRGCFTCKARRVKCDENQPICGACSLRGESCNWPAASASQHDTPDRSRTAGVDGSGHDEPIDSTPDPSSNQPEGPIIPSPQPLQFNVQPPNPTPDGGYPHLNMIDLQMHSHFMLHTAKSMSLNPRRQHAWERVIPRLAARNKAVMHLLLALAGLDLFSSNGAGEEIEDDTGVSAPEPHRSISNTPMERNSPGERSSAAVNREMDIAYLPIVVEHHQRGIKALREELSHVTSTNINHAFAGSMLIVAFALASLHIRNLNDLQPPNSQPPGPRVDWISLVQGIATVLQQNWMEVRIGPLRDLTHFIYGNDDWRIYPPQSFVGIRPRCRPCASRVLEFSKDAYEALMKLKSFHASLQPDPGHAESQTSPHQRQVLAAQSDALQTLENIYMRTLHVIRFSGYGSESPLGLQADLEDAAIMAWPHDVSTEFLATLREPGISAHLSYVILAYFYLVSSLLDCFWYIKEGFDEEIIKIEALIQESGDGGLVDLLKWPVSVISARLLAY